MIDGAAPGNGTPQARAGIGAIWGASPNDYFAAPVTDEIDPGQKRSNQRAEILAALHGLKAFALVAKANLAHNNGRGKSIWIMASDSQYLVKGITEWLPRWKVKSSLILVWVSHMPNK